MGLVLIIFFSPNRGYEKTLDRYFSAHEKQNANLLYSKVYADYWIDYTNEAWGDGVALDWIEESIFENLDNWDCGENVKISYKIKNKIRATKPELKELENCIIDEYIDYVGNKGSYKISAAYLLDVRVTIKNGSEKNEFYYPDGLLVIKENGKWKLTRGYISCSFLENHADAFQ